MNPAQQLQQRVDARWAVLVDPLDPDTLGLRGGPLAAYALGGATARVRWRVAGERIPV